MSVESITTFGYSTNTTQCITSFGYVCEEIQPVERAGRALELMIEQYRQDYTNG